MFDLVIAKRRHENRRALLAWTSLDLSLGQAALIGSNDLSGPDPIDRTIQKSPTRPNHVEQTLFRRFYCPLDSVAKAPATTCCNKPASKQATSAQGRNCRVLDAVPPVSSPILIT